jgi:hypothetical protein
LGLVAKLKSLIADLAVTESAVSRNLAGKRQKDFRRG